MRLIKISSKNFEEAVKAAVDTLERGGVVAYPTETFYGLGAKYDLKSALKRIYELKQRPKSKTMPLIIDSRKQLPMITDGITKKAEELMDKFWPGPLTLVLKARSGLSDHIVSDKRIAVRIPGESFALQLAQAAKFPITSTSANLSGQPPADKAEMVLKYFGDKIDLVIDGGKTSGGLPSTIVDVSEEEIKIIRKGAIELKTED